MPNRCAAHLPGPLTSSESGCISRSADRIIGARSPATSTDVASNINILPDSKQCCAIGLHVYICGYMYICIYEGDLLM